MQGTVGLVERHPSSALPGHGSGGCSGTVGWETSDEKCQQSFFGEGPFFYARCMHLDVVARCSLAMERAAGRRGLPRQRRLGGWEPITGLRGCHFGRSGCLGIKWIGTHGAVNDNQDDIFSG
jgi:hypothetical protein